MVPQILRQANMKTTHWTHTRLVTRKDIQDNFVDKSPNQCVAASTGPTCTGVNHKPHT